MLPGSDETDHESEDGDSNSVQVSGYAAPMDPGVLTIPQAD